MNTLAEPKIPVDREKIKDFCEKWKIKEFYLFGSVMRGDFGPDSDVDVLVKLTDYSKIGLYEWVDMAEELEALFNRKVDLVAAEGVRNPFIRHEIAQTRSLIHAA